MGGHNRAKSKSDFCAVAALPSCNCSIGAGAKSYVEVCDPGWPDSLNFMRKIRGVGRRPKTFEAHHILCAASIGTLIIDADNKKVSGIVEDTEWCINTGKNMLGMPLWGHTVQWYCNVSEKTLGSAKRGAPPFADLPQHDWDHTGTGAYQSEVNDALSKIVKDLSKTGHDATTGDLAGTLDRLSTKFKKELKSRGAARGTPPGTHAAWSNGRNAPSSQWYLPFSMASTDCVTGKGYPKLNFNDEFMYKLKWLAKQLK